MHRRKDYLVVANVGNVQRKMVWNDAELLPLDHPEGWTLGKMGTKICIFDKSLPNLEKMEQEAFFTRELQEHQRMVIDLPPAWRGRPNRSLDLTLIPLKPLKAPYMQTDPSAYDNPATPKQMMLYTGVRYFMLKYRPVGQTMTASSGGVSIFTYSAHAGGYTVTAHVSGVSLKTKDKKTQLPIGAARNFSPPEFFSAVFVHGMYWWRFRAVQTPDSMPPIEQEDSEEEMMEQDRFRTTSRVVVSLLLSLFALVAVFKKRLDPPVVTHVALEAPKVIPHAEIFKQPEPPKPTPTPLPIVEQPTPPPPKPPEPPKKVAEVKPKPKKPEPMKKNPPKIAKQEKPAPKVAAAAKPTPTVQPPPMVKANTPPATGVVTTKPPAPAPDQSAAVLKSLSFLSSNPKASAKGGVAYTPNTKKDFIAGPTLGGGSKDAKVLDSISNAAGDSKITTKSSRMISSDVKFAGKGKGLNDVQGKVSLNQIYGGGGGDFGTSTGIAISGPGSLSEAEIEKALEKFLSKFQFCYEKALISDSTLGGNLRLQWDITASGGVAAAKVIQSQMNNESLHSCILGVLKKVPFPSPKGGAVTAKKTFSFKSSSL
jgi:outer membrane biosynthesis protein TonB